MYEQRLRQKTIGSRRRRRRRCRQTPRRLVETLRRGPGRLGGRRSLLRARLLRSVSSVFVLLLLLLVFVLVVECQSSLAIVSFAATPSEIPTRKAKKKPKIWNRETRRRFGAIHVVRMRPSPSPSLCGSVRGFCRIFENVRRSRVYVPVRFEFRPHFGWKVSCFGCARSSLHGAWPSSSTRRCSVQEVGYAIRSRKSVLLRAWVYPRAGLSIAS